MTRIPAAFPRNLEPAADWRNDALCRQENAELFFPVGTSTDALLATEHAKSVCRRCPSATACLAYALDAPVPDGIWGGLTEGERAALLRARARHKLSAAEVEARVQAARRTKRPPRTMASVFTESTTRLYGGHLAWTGSTELKFAGKKYSPRQLAFTLDRGHFPDGRVLPDCGIKECVLARHLTDQTERAWRPARAKADVS